MDAVDNPARETPDFFEAAIRHGRLRTLIAGFVVSRSLVRFRRVALSETRIPYAFPRFRGGRGQSDVLPPPTTIPTTTANPERIRNAARNGSGAFLGAGSFAPILGRRPVVDESESKPVTRIENEMICRCPMPG